MRNELPVLSSVGRSVVVAALFAILIFGWTEPVARAADVSSTGALSPPFSLADGDRVVLLGSTMIERDQTHGYLETALTARFHSCWIEFRNLGWSGDNVFGEARARFGTVADGFAHLKQHVLALKPTVILLSYGTNESFAGPAGLETFLSGFDVLLHTLDETKARIVFISPLYQETLAPPLPNPVEHNRDLKLYCEAIARVAIKRQAPFVNLFELLGEKLPPGAGPLTDNGLHLTAYGYWRAATAIEHGLRLTERRWQVEIDVANRNVSANGTVLNEKRFSPTLVSFRALDEQLPLAPPPPGVSPEVIQAVSPRRLRVTGLADGKYTLKVSGQEVGTADASQWAAGVILGRGPDFEQAEKLRKRIVAKNRLYFYRWRPQNETYLFGFRKHEQGKNAVEIPQFDPLIAADEAAIHQLSTPVAREYQLVKVNAP